MNINISISGQGLDGWAQGMQERIRSALLTGAESVAEYAREICPVDTGELRDSISVSQSESGAVVYAEAEHGIYVEFGTYKMAAQPFLVPALKAAEDSVAEAIAAALA